MATKYTNRMKATIWTPTMKSEIDGTPDDATPVAFYALKSKKRREACLEELSKIHMKMTEREEQQQ